MARVLVTGGTGVLGREVVPRLRAAGHVVRVLSRQAAPARAGGGVEWATGDLGTGAGLVAALAGVDTVVHAASDPAGETRAVDVEGTGRLIEAMRAAGAGHLVYISIVGIDRHPLPYYRHKLRAEALITGGSVPWTVLRTTQFFDLIDSMLARAARRPQLYVTTDYVFQPLAVAEVAEALARAASGGARGRMPDMGGPEIRTLGELAQAWLRARGLERRVFYLPRRGAVAAAYRAGWHTAPERAVGRQRWEAWLAARYGSGGTVTR